MTLMSAAKEQFDAEAEALEHCEFLADLAAGLSPDDAAALLIGAALKVWEREFGTDRALTLASRALKTIVGAQQRPAGVH
jgi:hypothetical protein